MSSSVHRRERVGPAGMMRRLGFAIVLVRQMARDAANAQEHAGVVPGLGEHRRHVRGRVRIVARGEGAGLRQIAEDGGVELVHAAESTKLALEPVVVAVVIA